MGIAQQIDYFFKSTGQTVFIEAEAKESRMRNFIAEYNSKRKQLTRNRRKREWQKRI